jgi:hypothetical protein
MRNHTLEGGARRSGLERYTAFPALLTPTVNAPHARGRLSDKSSSVAGGRDIVFRSSA